MDIQKFNALRDKAVELFQAQPEKDKNKISLDAIFGGLCAQDAAAIVVGATAGAFLPERSPSAVKNATVPGAQQQPATWFTETLEALKGKGEVITIPRFLMFANRFPVKRMDQVNAARWLREAGYMPRKTGGQLVFDI